MAQFTMIPDGVTGTNEWNNYGGSSPQESCSLNDAATSYIYQTRLTDKEITFTMADPSVAEADIDFTEDVTVQPHMNVDYTFVGVTDTGAPHRYDFLDIGITGTSISLSELPKRITTEDGSYLTYDGTATTVYAPFNNWDYARLQNCQVKLETTTNNVARFHQLRVTYVYITVDYTVVVAADNATFFGANF